MSVESKWGEQPVLLRMSFKNHESEEELFILGKKTPFVLGKETG